MAVAGFSEIEALRRQVSGSIEGIKKAIELLPFWDDINNLQLELVTPLGYLLALVDALGLLDDLKEWLAKYLTYAMPALEIGVKGVLLSNLMSCISCSTNPFIPDDLRELFYIETFKLGTPTMKVNGKFFEGDDEKDTDDKEKKTKVELQWGEFSFESEPRHGAGLRIPVSSIDYSNLLNHSPFEEWNQLLNFVDYSKMYFGVDKETTSPYELARATDFNAYLWFVKNRGYLKDCIVADRIEDITTQRDAHLLEYIKVSSGVGSKVLGVSDGTGVRYNDTCALSVICGTERNKSGQLTAFKVIPASSNGSAQYKPAFNWYFNIKDAFSNNLIALKNAERHYEKDKPILSLSFDNGEYVFKILPKPQFHYPILIPKKGKIQCMDGSEVTLDKAYHEKLTHVKRILFNAAGEPTKMLKGGRFTVYPRVVNGRVQKFLENSSDHDNYVYELYRTKEVYGSPESTAPEDRLVLKYNAKTAEYKLARYQGAREVSNIPDEMLVAYMFECYAGMTVYQFNFDYIMGMRLFDANVVIAKIMESLFNLNVDLKLTAEQAEMEAEIRQVVRKIIDTPDTTSDDCYFSFSNDEIKHLTEEAENKRRGGSEFLSGGFLADDDRALLQEAMQNVASSSNKIVQQEQITNLLETAPSVAIKYSDAETTYGLQSGFFEQFCIELLLQIVMNSIMTPKVAMLWQVNQYFTGGSNFISVDGKVNYNDLSNLRISVNYKAMLKSIFMLLFSMAKEIIVLFLEELFQLIMAKLGTIFAMFSLGIIAEYLAVFTELIKEIIEQCGFRIGMSKNGQIDKVDYADIDALPESSEETQPSNNNC